MKRTDGLERLLEAALAVRLADRDRTAETARVHLAQAQRALRREIGVGVPKTLAARLLGVSTTALERWVTLGRLPVVRRPRGREEIDVVALLDLLEETTLVREEGWQRGVLAEAFRRLGERGLPRRRLRPNLSAHELRADFLATTPAERLREGAELSELATTFAGRRERGA